MNPVDPYAPPKEESFLDLPTTDCMTDGKFLYVRNGAALPARCAVTNGELTDGSMQYSRKFTYTPPWVWLLILANLIIALIVALILQKKVAVIYWLSDEARARFRRRCWLAMGCILASVGTIFAGTQVNHESVLIAFIVLGIGLFIAGMGFWVTANPLKVKGYKNGVMRIKGCSPAFLQSLPQGGFTAFGQP